MWQSLPLLPRPPLLLPQPPKRLPLPMLRLLPRQSLLSPCRKVLARQRPRPLPSPLSKPTLPPPRPSLVLSLISHTLDTTLKTQAGVLAPGLMGVCNDALASIPTFASVRVSACRWTPKGNLVIFTGPDISRDQLSAASHLLTMAVAASLPDASVHVSSHLDVRWAKVLVNGVPTGVQDDSPATHSPSVCLQDLLENNPSLRPLKVTQLPSWVWAPRLFQPGSSSSLVFVFEDPDGSIDRKSTRLNSSHVD